MAAPSNPSRNSSVKVNPSDGLKNVLLSNAAYGHQVFPRISSSEGLKIVLPAPASPSSAFDGLVNDPSAAASTSTESSSGMEHPPYDIFINHHGEDTKRTIAKNIYKKLVATGLRVFLDQDELRLGDLFPKVLQEAMASASLHIAIFSENYARSPWCLAELTFILQLPNIKFIPIFYRVEPFTVRWAIENYADAFKEHEGKGRFSLEKLQSWKSALKKASFYNGEKISNQSDAQKAVMNVVNRVLKELKEVRLDVAKHPVGLDELQQDFHKQIALQSAAAGPIQIVGIWGMGGVGKTTLAKQLYNEKSSTMKMSSFVFDVSEAARKKCLHEKQNELLKDLDLDLESNDIKNVELGKGILSRRLRSISVLIVLDDVDHRDQLDALLPARDNLGQGSLIIITTREFHVLQEWGISAVYEITTLNPAHAHQLFCWHAFGQPSPLLGFEEIAQKFIDTCHGLPLSLMVLGSQLYGESSEAHWHALLHKVSRIMPDDIKMRLRISYDALDKEDKEMFLDVACLFFQVITSTAIAVWDGSGWNGLNGLQRLVDKCLVSLEEKKYITYIRMHDNLRDLGREIANQHSPYRLWSEHQIIEIQPQQEAIRVRGMADAFGDNCYPREGKIILNTSQGERILEPGSLGLKILFDEGYFINEQCSEISRELLFLQCDRFEHERFPSWLSLKNLRVLELCESQRLQDLWEPAVDVPSQSRELFISEVCRLEKIESFERPRLLERLVIHDGAELNTLPSLVELTCLREFDLRRCIKLEKIESFKSLRSLERLTIYDCTELNRLPSLAEVTSLKMFELVGCKKLEKIESLENLRSLERLVIHDYIESNTLPNLAELTSLKEFDLRRCKKLEKIENLEILRSLEILIILDCTKLNTLPSLAELTSLKEFDLRRCNKVEKIESLESLTSLETLRIHDCTELKTLPSLAEVTSLKEFELRGCNKLEKIESLRGLTSLETLIIYDCTELNTLPSLADATSLKMFKLKHCNKLEKIESLESLRSLETLIIYDCTELNTLPSLAEATSLKEFELRCCNKLEKIESLRGLRPLETLIIYDCTELNTLPSLADATSLKEFELRRCNKLEKIESLESLRSLETLIIYGCTELNTLPSLAEATSLKEFQLRDCNKLEKIESLRGLSSLETLIIYDCIVLNTLSSLADATSLKMFKLKRCNKLEKIESLESLRSLETLIIYDCTELNTLPSLAEATSLKEFELRRCNKLEKIESLESLTSLETLTIYDCTELRTLPSLAEATSLKEFELRRCNKLEKIESLESLRSLETLIIYDCTELNTLPSLAEATSLKEFQLRDCNKLEKIESLRGLRSLETLIIYDCMELNTLPSLAELTCLKEFKIKRCQKLDTIEGLQGLTSLEKLTVHTWWKRTCMFSLEHSDSLEALEVVANDRSVIGPSISNIQKWQREASANIVQKWRREVIVCTRAVIDVDSLKSFFTSFPLKNVVEYGSSGGLTLTMPESAANAILICFVIDYVHPNIRFCISTDKDNRFDTEMSNGKWLWMGIFPEGSNWLQAKRYQIRALCGEKEVKVKEARLLKGKEQSILEAFHQLSQR